MRIKTNIRRNEFGENVYKVDKEYKYDGGEEVLKEDFDEAMTVIAYTYGEYFSGYHLTDDERGRFDNAVELIHKLGEVVEGE